MLHLYENLLPHDALFHDYTHAMPLSDYFYLMEDSAPLN